MHLRRRICRRYRTHPTIHVRKFVLSCNKCINLFGDGRKFADDSSKCIITDAVRSGATVCVRFQQTLVLGCS